MTTLDELFDKDPLDLTNTDLDILIADLRNRRAQFNLTNAGGKVNVTKTKPAPSPEELAKGQDLLAKLGLFKK